MTDTLVHRTEHPPTPQWLVTGELALCPCGCIGRRRKGSFIEKTLSGAVGVMRAAMFGDDVAQQHGFLQRLDPRVKIVSFLGLLLVTAFVRNIPTLVAMYLTTVLLAIVSALPVGFFIKRVWLFIPIFTGIIVIPAMFSFITPGTIVLPLWHWNGHPVGITSQGLTGAGLLIMRVATSVSLIVLLTLTTPWTKLLAGLRALWIPRIFILIIGMAYRYIFLLLNSVTDMYTSRKARSVGNQPADYKEGQRVVGATAGALFGKAHALSEEVHMAMVSRGYAGDAKTYSAFTVRAIDVAFALGCVLTAVLVLRGDRLLGV